MRDCVTFFTFLKLKKGRCSDLRETVDVWSKTLSLFIASNQTNFNAI